MAAETYHRLRIPTRPTEKKSTGEEPLHRGGHRGQQRRAAARSRAEVIGSAIGHRSLCGAYGLTGDAHDELLATRSTSPDRRGVDQLMAFQALDLETEFVDRERAIYRIDGRLWHDRHGLLDGSGYIHNN